MTAPHFPTNPKASIQAKPAAVATGDFNRDGKLDAVTANSGSDEVALLRGKGNGLFAAPAVFRVGKTPVALVAADLKIEPCKTYPAVQAAA